MKPLLRSLLVMTFLLLSWNAKANSLSFDRCAHIAEGLIMAHLEDGAEVDTSTQRQFRYPDAFGYYVQTHSRGKLFCTVELRVELSECKGIKLPIRCGHSQYDVEPI